MNPQLTCQRTTPPRNTLIILDQPGLQRDTLAKLLNSQPELEILLQTEFSIDSMEQIIQLQPSLVLADPCHNPETNLAFIERLLLLHRELPVMLIASPCNPDTFVRLIRAGISGVFLKTQGFDVLLKAIHRVLKGELWFERSLIKDMVATGEDFFQRSASNHNHLNRLSKREQQITDLVVNGLNTQTIAKNLHISEKTVRNHIYAIYGKLEVSDRLSLVKFVTENRKLPK